MLLENLSFELKKKSGLRTVIDVGVISLITIRSNEFSISTRRNPMNPMLTFSFFDSGKIYFPQKDDFMVHYISSALF